MAWYPNLSLTTHFEVTISKILSSVFVCVVLFVVQSLQAEIKKDSSIWVTGNIHEANDISAIAYTGKMLIFGSDEGVHIQLLDTLNNKENFLAFHARPELIKLLDSQTEIDIEGMAWAQDTLYVVGSHSLKRQKLKPNLKTLKNRVRIANVQIEESRNHLFRIKYDDEKMQFESRIRRINLKNILTSDPILNRFCNIPGKENGIDIEGIAVDENQMLYLGFRSPVLRNNFVPVLVFSFVDPTRYSLLFINLNGDGIRDITKVKDGFLLISGPAGDRKGSYQIYFWDGVDGIPGIDKTPSKPVSLGVIPTSPGAKPEGLAVTEETNSYFKVIVVFDGVRNGNATLFNIPKSLPPTDEVSSNPKFENQNKSE